MVRCCDGEVLPETPPIWPLRRCARALRKSQEGPRSLSTNVAVAGHYDPGLVSGPTADIGSCIYAHHFPEGGTLATGLATGPEAGVDSYADYFPECDTDYAQYFLEKGCVRAWSSAHRF